tara:strand:+ start:935 stop:1270 length:336 start_codon:yes stop_codon:yes gene_type:complete
MTVIIPKKKPKKTKENTVDNRSIWKKIASKFSGGTEVDRSKQFADYLSWIDQLENRKMSLRGRVRDPGTDLNFRSGRVTTANTTKMSTILDRYHDRALRLAQAKYYQKQVG